MKKSRHQDLINIIATSTIRTQEELTQKLASLGYDVTQATVSRDIKELKIIKIADETGNLKYCVPNMTLKAKNDLLVWPHLIKNVRTSLNIIVLKTNVGMAQGVAAAIDDMSLSEILGTIAGDDTIMLVCDSPENAIKIDTYLNDNLL